MFQRRMFSSTPMAHCWLRTMSIVVQLHGSFWNSELIVCTFISVNVQKNETYVLPQSSENYVSLSSFFRHSSSCVLCQHIAMEHVNSTKYLDIFLDNDLSWNPHLSYIAKQLRFFCMLYRVRSFLSISVRKLITSEVAYSILRYWITIFGNCPTDWQEKINSILRDILRSVADGTTLEEGDDILHVSGYFNFSSLLQHSFKTNLKCQEHIIVLWTLPLVFLPTCFYRLW